ncbi:MAG: hypothetical protein K2Y26_05945 [Gemmatimonadaceae bacterium]|jgi:hypothetical protein|nr:hypothetical protein [Gemmatimonadaceae bacterium]MBX9855044.1 hypothetical protein [Gemmatimonadaceae bacterium]
MPIAEQTFGELLSLGHTTKLLALRLQLLLEQLDPLTQGFQLRSSPAASLESPNSAQSQVPGTSESCQKEERPNQDKDECENFRHVLKGTEMGRLVNRNAAACTTACPTEFHRPPGIFAPGRPNEQEWFLN